MGHKNLGFLLVENGIYGRNYDLGTTCACCYWCVSGQGSRILFMHILVCSVRSIFISVFIEINEKLRVQTYSLQPNPTPWIVLLFSVFLTPSPAVGSLAPITGWLNSLPVCNPMFLWLPHLSPPHSGPYPCAGLLPACSEALPPGLGCCLPPVPVLIAHVGFMLCMQGCRASWYMMDASCVRHRLLLPSCHPSVYYGILVSYSCHNKWLQTRKFKTTEIYPLTVLEAGSLKSGCRQSWFLLGAPRDSLFHSCLFWPLWLLAILGILWLVDTSFLPLSLSPNGILLWVSKSPLQKSVPHGGFRIYWGSGHTTSKYDSRSQNASSQNTLWCISSWLFWETLDRGVDLESYAFVFKKWCL